jgi:hypothetical protein
MPLCPFLFLPSSLYKRDTWALSPCCSTSSRLRKRCCIQHHQCSSWGRAASRCRPCHWVTAQGHRCSSPRPPGSSACRATAPSTSLVVRPLFRPHVVVQRRWAPHQRVRFRRSFSPHFMFSPPGSMPICRLIRYISVASVSADPSSPGGCSLKFTEGCSSDDWSCCHIAFLLPHQFSALCRLPSITTSIRGEKPSLMLA